MTAEFVRSELLCFVQQKSKVLAFDDLVALCVDFYASDEIKLAATTLSKYVQQKLPIHKGVDRQKICI